MRNISGDITVSDTRTSPLRSGRPALGHLPGYYRPPCGFFLWLRVDDGAALTRRLWAERALKVLPGEYLTQPAPDGSNDGRAFVRIALVQDLPVTDEGLARVASLL